MDNFLQYFDMGKYAIYVYPSFAMTFLLMLLEPLLLHFKHQKIIQRLKRMQRINRSSL